MRRDREQERERDRERSLYNLILASIARVKVYSSQSTLLLDRKKSETSLLRNSYSANRSYIPLALAVTRIILNQRLQHSFSCRSLLYSHEEKTL